jgi:hypothetical protein
VRRRPTTGAGQRQERDARPFGACVAALGLDALSDLVLWCAWEDEGALDDFEVGETPLRPALRRVAHEWSELGEWELLPDEWSPALYEGCGSWSFTVQDGVEYVNGREGLPTARNRED